MKRHITRTIPARNGGSTLTEVLISTMVLSIGVLSVGTLFPMSLARAIRANQITQGTIHRYNCEALIEGLKLNSYWMFVVEPGLNADALNNLDNHFPGAFAVDDDAGGATDIVITPPNFGFTPGRDGLPGVAGVDDDNDGTIDEIDGSEMGFSGTTASSVSDDQPIMDEAELLWNGFDTKKLVIDPLGWHLMATADLGAGANYQNNFGGDVMVPAIAASTPFETVGSTVIPRVNGGYFANNQFRTSNPRVRPMYWNDRVADGSPTDELPATGGFGFTQAQAEELVTLQDQFATVIDTPFSDAPNIAGIGARDFLDLSSALKLSDLQDIENALAGGLKVQAVFFGLKNAASPIVWNETRFLIDNDTSTTNPDGSIYWNPVATLPPEFQIERVVLQIQNLDFTWMITARLTSPPPTRPQMDVVIFHKRRFEAKDEQLYIATQTGGNQNVVEVTFPAGNEPFAKKGGWLFDVEHCFWYQIANIVETPANNPTKYTITLEHNIRDRFDGANDDPNKIAVAFMRGIVDVFPIGTK